MDPTGARGSLNGQYVFDRFNPAVGLTYSPSRFANVYFSYSEASRAPTAIELGCADPNEPCNLPNALVSDPPLKQVVTRTFEAGVRGSLESNLRWSAGWFRGGELQRPSLRGIRADRLRLFHQLRQDAPARASEVNLSGQIGTSRLGGNYTFLDATYQSPQTVDGGSNSANDGGAGLDGNIHVQPGDRIPQIPRNIFKAYVDCTSPRRKSRWISTSMRWDDRSRAATRTIWTNRTASTTSDLDSRPATVS